MGRSTAIKLEELNVGHKVMYFKNRPQIMDSYKEVFKGVGNLKDYQLKLYIDSNVTPVAQPTRCVPFSLKDKVKDRYASGESSNHHGETLNSDS